MLKQILKASLAGTYYFNFNNYSSIDIEETGRHLKTRVIEYKRRNKEEE